jgi:methylmalonyl-CoA carboxyltransferase large subunit
MPTVTVTELALSLEQLQAQMAEISRQIALLENQSRDLSLENQSRDREGAIAARPPVRPQPAPAAITEEELLAISAAIGAYLGVRAHIRQIRLVGTSAWAQQGRVSIQASHMLQG